MTKYEIFYGLSQRFTKAELEAMGYDPMSVWRMIKRFEDAKRAFEAKQKKVK